VSQYMLTIYLIRFLQLILVGNTIS
jgi:hypothetical protein